MEDLICRNAPSLLKSPATLDNISIQRPRNLDWQRASALLYGDWGTSKAYVLGLTFAAIGFSSLPIILAVSSVCIHYTF